MKFRIIRDYEYFKPQVWEDGEDVSCYIDFVNYSLTTIEEAERECAVYKRMVEDLVVKEFEL